MEASIRVIYITAIEHKTCKVSEYLTQHSPMHLQCNNHNNNHKEHNNKLGTHNYEGIRTLQGNCL